MSVATVEKLVITEGRIYRELYVVALRWKQAEDALDEWQQQNPDRFLDGEISGEYGRLLDAQRRCRDEMLSHIRAVEIIEDAAAASTGD